MICGLITHSALKIDNFHEFGKEVGTDSDFGFPHIVCPWRVMTSKAPVGDGLDGWRTGSASASASAEILLNTPSS